MRVRIRADLCQGHSMCVIACPEVFKLNDEDGHAYVLMEDVRADLQWKVRQAEQSCPEQAIDLGTAT
jgi:ferredoxin